MQLLPKRGCLSDLSRANDNLFCHSQPVFSHAKGPEGRRALPAAFSPCLFSFLSLSPIISSGLNIGAPAQEVSHQTVMPVTRVFKKSLAIYTYRLQLQALRQVYISHKMQLLAQSHGSTHPPLTLFHPLWLSGGPGSFSTGAYTPA